LGTGAAATVYSAREEETDDSWAIKVLSSSAVYDENMQRRFLREIAVMQDVSHENLVQIREGGLHGDTYYYVMELVDSGTLKDVLVGPLPWRDVAECGVQLIAALAVLHENGIVHRDLKPGNIYLSSSGHVKIGDFGLARDLRSSRLTVDGMTVGTVLYMSPEQIRGDDIDGSADLYTLGCVLFEMLTGHPPFDGPTAMDVWEHHLGTAPPSPRAAGADCPEDLGKLVQQLMSKQPSDRPSSARVVGDALREILAGNALAGKTDPVGVPSGNKSTSSASSAPADVESPNLTERLRQPQLPERSPTSWLTLAAIFAGILVVIGLAAVFGGA
jgi:serine/threonine protein kinase